MQYKLPNSYHWFIKLRLIKFIPWKFEADLNANAGINKQFEIECNQNRQLLTFGRRQDMDTFAGFEIVDGNLTETVVVFHPSFQQNVDGWNIIESEYLDFFEFLQKQVLPDMKDWIQDDDVEGYI